LQFNWKETRTNNFQGALNINLLFLIHELGPRYLLICYPFWSFVVCFIFMLKNCYPRIFLDYSHHFMHFVSKTRLLGENRVPLLSTVLVFAWLSQNVTHSENKGYLLLFSFFVYDSLSAYKQFELIQTFSSFLHTFSTGKIINLDRGG